MNFQPMTQTEYDIWKPRCHAGYADEKMKANGYTREEANKIADDSFRTLLPQGVNSENSLLFTARSDGEIVGFAWLGIRGAANNRVGFVYDIVVEEKFRGRGFGRKIMLELEKEARKAGLKRIGLHVFGHNETAINLYRSLGYLTTDLVMEKSL